MRDGGLVVTLEWRKGGRMEGEKGVHFRSHGGAGRVAPVVVALRHEVVEVGDYVFELFWKWCQHRVCALLVADGKRKRTIYIIQGDWYWRHGDLIVKSCLCLGGCWCIQTIRR